MRDYFPGSKPNSIRINSMLPVFLLLSGQWYKWFDYFRVNSWKWKGPRDRSFMLPFQKERTGLGAVAYLLITWLDEHWTQEESKTPRCTCPHTFHCVNRNGTVWSWGDGDRWLLSAHGPTSLAYSAKSRPLRDPVSIAKVDEKQYPRLTSGFHVCAHMCACALTHTDLCAHMHTQKWGASWLHLYHTVDSSPSVD